MISATVTSNGAASMSCAPILTRTKSNPRTLDIVPVLNQQCAALRTTSGEMRLPPHRNDSLSAPRSRRRPRRPPSTGTVPEVHLHAVDDARLDGRAACVGNLAVEDGVGDVVGVEGGERGVEVHGRAGADRAGTLAEVGGFRGWRAGSLGGRGTRGRRARRRAREGGTPPRGGREGRRNARRGRDTSVRVHSSRRRRRRAPRVGDSRGAGVSTPAASTRASVASEQQRGGHHRRARAREDAREARPRHDTDPTRDGVRRRHHEYRALRQLRLAPLSSAWRFIRPRATTTRLVFVEPSEDWSARARGVDEVRGRRPTVACRRGEGICDICETLSPPISLPFSPLLRSTCWLARCPPPCTP